jgi:hypothetical protein
MPKNGRKEEQMAFYLKGIGDAATRQNEILPRLDACINRFLTGHDNGVLRGELNEFSHQLVDRGIVIRSGILQSQGYFAMSDTDTQINFVLPSGGTQYSHIYAEIDLSVVPNIFSIKVTAVSNSPAFQGIFTNLAQFPSGKTQLRLYALTLTSAGITVTEDARFFIDKPQRAANADNAATAESAKNMVVGGGIYNSFENFNELLSTQYMRVRSLKKAGVTYGNVDVGSGAVYFDMEVPSASAAYLILQGTLQCANAYSVQLFVDLLKTDYAPQLIWVRSVNGQVNTSYGFISMEAERSGNRILLLVYKINQYNNTYGDSHAYASGCKFQVTDILEVTNTKK